MSDATILFAGPPLAGNHTTVQAVATLCGEASRRLRPLGTRAAPWIEVDWPFFSRPVSIRLTCGWTRTRSGPQMPENDESISRCFSLASGLYFVCDSQSEMQQWNHQAIEFSKRRLASVGRDWRAMPAVVALNKRDLPDVEAVEALRSTIRWPGCGYAETVATTGRGIVEAINQLLGRLVP